MARQRTITSGETLSGIARREKTTIPDLLRLNPNIKDPNVIFAGAKLNLPGTEPSPLRDTGADATRRQRVDEGAGAGISGAIRRRAGTEPSARDDLLSRLTKAISGVEAFDPVARRKELEEERGISGEGGIRERIGTFEEEINKTQSLIDQLEGDIKARTGEFLLPEESRRRLLASEQAPLVEQLSTFGRGLTTATGRLERERLGISDILGTEREAARTPLDLLTREFGARADIEALTADEEAASREASIIDLINQGVNDPVELHSLLNLDEEGATIGDVSLKEIQDVFTSLEPKQRNTQITTIGGNKVVVDTQTGETIANLGPDISSQLTQAQIRQINANISKLNAETAAAITDATGKTDLQKIIGKLGAAGERDTIRAGISLHHNAKKLITLLETVGTGPLVGRIQQGTEIFGLQVTPSLQQFGLSSDDFNDLQASSTVFTANFIKFISGAQVSDKERQFLMRALPDPNKQQEQNRAGIKAIIEWADNTLNAFNIDPTQYREEIPDPFATPNAAEFDEE